MIVPLLRECAPVRAFRAYVPPAAAAILTLEADACHWPVGDVEADAFHFCRSPRRSGSYCEAHARLARRGRS